MGQHDVQMGQCQAIFSAVDSERNEAVSVGSTVAAELETLVAAAHHPQLVAALQALQTEAFQPQINNAEQRVSSASSTGHEVLGLVNQGDQQMSSQAQTAQGQVPGLLDAPGSTGAR